MEHPDLFDYNVSIYWAKRVLENKEKYLILDTETTGLGEKDVIIQIGVIDLEGNLLVDSLVKPTQKKSISREATAIHGIKTKDLFNAPNFGDILIEIQPHIEAGKEFLIYNFDFDKRLIEQTFYHDNLRGRLVFSGDCVMKKYSQFVGEWNPYYGDYKYQRLPGANHNAVGDCKAALQVIQLMAGSELADIPNEYKSTKKTESRSNISSNSPSKALQTNQQESLSACGCVAAIILVFAFMVLFNLC